MAMRVAVIENHGSSSMGVVGATLADAGVSVDVIWGGYGDAVPRETHHDALVVLGGTMNAADDRRCPYFPDVMAVVRHFTTQEKPVFGICLGAQLIARAFDSALWLDRDCEFGFQPITPTAEAVADPVFSALEREQPMFQWHTDHFALPAGATRLATNGNYPNQAFRIGRATYGCQFHPEADRSLVDSWLVEYTGSHDDARDHEAWLPAQFQAYEAGSITLCRKLMRRWLSLAA